MKNILIVSASFRGGGAERLSVQLANNCYIEGYSVCYFVGVGEGPYKSEINRNIKLYDANETRFSNCIIRLAKLLRDNDFDAIFCSQEYVISIVYLAKLLSLSKANIIGREASTPSKNMVSSRVMAKLLKVITQSVYRNIHMLIAPSQAISTDIKEYYGIQRNITVLPNFVDKKEIEKLSLISSGFDFKKDCVYLVMVGRLVKMKGVETAIRALSIIDRKDVHLILLGEGPELDSLKGTSLTLGVQDNVHFLGFVSNPFCFIKKADIFILASKYEGMPNSLIQALILNTYSLSTKNSEMVSDYLDDSCTFEFGDESDLADKLKFAIENDYPLKNKCDFMEAKDYINIIFGKGFL